MVIEINPKEKNSLYDHLKLNFVAMFSFGWIDKHLCSISSGILRIRLSN